MKTCATYGSILGLLAGFLLFAATAGAAPAGQPMNPIYLIDMPTPARILSEIKGKDAEDTIERQMGAFQALMKVVDDMAWGLEKRYLPIRATPDENRVKQAYAVAYAELWHKATNNEAHAYDHDRKLMDELVTRIFSDRLRQTYMISWTKTGENSKAQFQKNFGGGSGSSAGSGSTAAAGGGDFDKLCAAKGLDGMTCMVQSMMGGLMKATAAVQGPPTPGLRMSGLYQAGNFKMILDQGPSAWLNCDGVFLLSSYEVQRGGDRTLVKVANGGTPFVLALAEDGTTLVGPAAVVIHGRAPGGSGTVTTPGSTREVTTTTQRTLTPLEAQQYPDAVQNGQTYTLSEQSTTTESTPGTSSPVPAYHPSTASCRVGAIAAAPVRPAAAQPKPSGVSGWIAGMIPSSPVVPNGIRIAGSYDGAGGASLEFEPDKAILACHATLEEHPYTVVSRGGQLLIRLGGATALDFSLGPDGTIRGDGGVRLLNGRRKTGEDTLGDPTYAPSSDTCGYAALAPRLAAKARN